MEAPELSSSAAKARGQEPQAVEALTAFVVVITKQGSVMVVPDLDENIEVDHTTSEGEVEMACKSIVENMATTRQATMTAQLIVNSMMQAGQQMQSQQVNKKLIEDINAGRVRPPR